MSSTDPLASSENKYVIDIEVGAETSRLIEQDQLFTRAMGGLLPEQSDLSQVSELLDLACGPGGWALEVAFQHPDIEVVGIDINETMIRYAIAQARVRGLQNVSFEVMDVRKPLEFPDASFDLINARFICGFMDQASWPVLIAECKRILRPGGILRFTETEYSVSNSLAMQQIGDHLYQAFALQKRTFSVNGHSMGLAHILRKLLHDAGFEGVQRHAFCLDASYGSDLYASTYKDTEMAGLLLKPYLVKSGIVEEAAHEQLYQTMLTEMQSDDFSCVIFGLTTWGCKPEA
ncbi:MAG TPA: methyltransferase domain-containing protein [Ktedonobacteraceae bacterium]|nr:methyltransferase domain-containing protein [Ktedonobacteraceae bacterium]